MLFSYFKSLIALEQQGLGTEGLEYSILPLSLLKAQVFIIE